MNIPNVFETILIAAVGLVLFWFIMKSTRITVARKVTIVLFVVGVCVAVWINLNAFYYLGLTQMISITALLFIIVWLTIKSKRISSLKKIAITSAIFMVYLGFSPNVPVFLYYTGFASSVLEPIAHCESGGAHYAENGKIVRGAANPHDIGKYQINERIWGKKARELGYNLRTEKGNKKMAAWLFKHYGLAPWKLSRQCWGELF